MPPATAQISDERAAVTDTPSGASRLCAFSAHVYCVANAGHPYHDGRLPDLFLHLGGTHVHHLNYGIFLLSTIGAVLLFGKVNHAQWAACAVVYGIGMALTFDEFGMWLHLGGSYWQRASFDAVIVLLSISD